MVVSSVSEAMAKRRENVKMKRETGSSDAGSNSGTHKDNTPSTTTKYFEKKIEQFESAFKDKDKEIEVLKMEVQACKGVDMIKDTEISKLKVVQTSQKDALAQIEQERAQLMQVIDQLKAEQARQKESQQS